MGCETKVCVLYWKIFLATILQTMGKLTHLTKQFRLEIFFSQIMYFHQGNEDKVLFHLWYFFVNVHNERYYVILQAGEVIRTTFGNFLIVTEIVKKLDLFL